MYPAFNAFSVLTKGYACGLGTGGYEAFAVLSKGYVCQGVVVEPIHGSDSSKGQWAKKYELDTSMETMLAREDQEAVAIVMAISRRRRH